MSAFADKADMAIRHERPVHPPVPRRSCEI